MPPPTVAALTIVTAGPPAVVLIATHLVGSVMLKVSCAEVLHPLSPADVSPALIGKEA